VRLATVLEEALDLLGAADEVLQAQLIALLSDDIPSLVSGEVARARRERAREIAERRSLGDVAARLLGSDGTTAMQRGEFETAASLWRRASRTPGVRPAFAWRARVWEADFVALSGDLSRWRELLESALQEPDVKRSRVAQHTLAGTLALERLARADIAGVEDLERELGHPDDYLWWIARAHLALLDGNREKCGDALARLDPVARAPVVGPLALATQTQLYWELGDVELASRAFAHWREHWAALGLRGFAAGADLRVEDLATTAGPLPVTMLGRAAAHLADSAEREALRVIVRDQPGMFVGRLGDACAQRAYGDWALALDMPEDAERLYRNALAWCERERCPIEAGKCHQGLAELAERRGERDLAMQHLDAASELFARHGAKFWLDQVIAKKQILKA